MNKKERELVISLLIEEYRGLVKSLIEINETIHDPHIDDTINAIRVIAKTVNYLRTYDR